MNGWGRIALVGVLGIGPWACLGRTVDKAKEAGDDLANQVTTALDGAINAISAQSDNWQAVLQGLVDKLPKEVQSTVTNEVTNLMNRGVAAVGVETMCGTDFFANRMKQGLQSIKIQFLGGTPLPVEPQLCQVVPLAVDMNLEPERRNKIEFYGYDFDQTKIAVVLATDSAETDVTRFLDQPTHYHLTLNLGSSGIQIGPDARRLVLRWEDRPISTIGILQPNPNICQSQLKEAALSAVSLMPGRTRGDAEFDGNGPAVNATVTLLNLGTHVDARVYMKAVETESDWSTAEETRSFTVFSADPGWVIDQIVTPTSASYSYTDTNHNNDEFAGSGPVQKWTFVGDDDGDDIGTHTRVEVAFNNLRVELKQDQNCVSMRTLDLVKEQKFLSAPALQKLDAARKIVFPPSP